MQVVLQGATGGKDHFITRIMQVMGVITVVAKENCLTSKYLSKVPAQPT